MSAYTSVESLQQAVGENTLVQLTDNNNTGQIDLAAIDQAIETASGEIDMSLAQRYAIPLLNPPLTVQVVCQDLAIYHLHRGKLLNEDARLRYEDARVTLKNLAAGNLALPGVPAAQAASAPAAGQMVGVSEMPATAWGAY